MTAEDLTKVLGKPGRFQAVLYIMLASNYVYVSWNHLGMAFMAAKTKHHCQVENKTSVSSIVPMIVKDGKEQWDGCHLYTDKNKTAKVPCTNGWTYYLPDQEWTVVAEWDLVCDDAYKASLATTTYFVGVMLGSLVFGTLSDKFGRRPVVLFTMYSPSVIGLLLFFFKNYIAFVILRFILGFLIQGLQLASFVSFVEVLAIQYRTGAGVCAGLFWSLGVMSLALISYLIQDWRYIQLFTTLAGLFQIGLLCFLPESIRWLLTKKRTDETEKVVKRISTFNKIPFPRQVFDETAAKSLKTEIKAAEAKKSYTIVDIFRSSVLRKRSIILAVVWFSITFSYYGLALNVSSLAGNKYLNFFISGVFEMTVIGVTVFILQRFGRRKPLCLYCLVGGTTCILAGVLPSETKGLQSFVTALALCGRVCMSACFSVLSIYTSELYPTVIRNVGLGAGIFWARIGSIVAPQILLLGKYAGDSIPFIIMGACVLVAGSLALLLPETLNVKLPETMEDAGKFEKMPREHVELRNYSDIKKEDDEALIQKNSPRNMRSLSTDGVNETDAELLAGAQDLSNSLKIEDQNLV